MTYVAFDPQGTPIVTNEANAAAGKLPAGATPPVSTDEQKAAAPLGDDATTTATAQPAPTDDQRIAMGLDSNNSTPYNAARDFFANPEGTIVARALQGVDDATITRAQTLMEDAQRREIQLTSAEAVQQASNGASGLGRLQRLTEGTTGGSAVLSPIMANRPGQVSDAFNAALDRIAPATNQPSMIGVQGQEAANDAIDAVRRVPRRRRPDAIRGRLCTYCQ